MLPQLILILGALLAFWLLSNWFARVKPSVAARVLKRAGYAALVVLGLWLVLTGKLAGLFAIAMGLMPWVMRLARLHGLYQVLRRFGIQMRGGAPSPGKASQVETRFLRMELDHDSGRLDGDILEGTYGGRRLSQLSEAQAVELWREVQADSESARVLEAWLERAWPEWREDGWREDAHPAQPSKSGMTMDEAREILGLSATAGADDIRAAHRRLMLANHPDHGGSTWIAARINQARDLLLGG
ncbi:MAG: molecular chaperone DnaJ [Rhodospirillaceae bacterium]|nr:molecular chaperone DnaJ [Rhodospirillales bacterium]